MEPVEPYVVPVWEGPDPWPVALPPSLEVTWSVLDREPGMDDIMEKVGSSLEKMTEDLKIFPYQDKDREDRLFLARFEFPKYDEPFQFPEAVTATEPAGFIDFLGGFPIDCIEMLVAIGELSSKVKEGEDSKVNVQPGTGVTAPVPKGDSHFFKWPEKDKILLNLTALPTKDVGDILAKNLEGEPKPEKPHWWFRAQMTFGTEEIPKKFPVPGEFLGLGIRMMPGEYWGHQKSSPFIYSGYFMDTVYYTGARITEVIEPTDDILYPTYKVQWRVCDLSEQDGIIENVRPSDFAEYRVGDRVTILKDVATEKKTQLWKDEDMENYGETWVIAPISFYELPEGG